MVYAAGIVTYIIENGAIRYLILHHNAGHWGFPKGRREEGENDQQTALRELHEETGLIIKDFDSVFRLSSSYEVLLNNEYVPKTVTYFVGQPVDTNVLLSDEHDQFAWCTFQEAIDLLTHVSSKELLIKVNAHIEESSDI